MTQGFIATDTNLLTDKGTGADPTTPRPLRRAIERLIEDPMAERLLHEGIGEGVTLYADINDEGDALEFTQEPPANRGRRKLTPSSATQPQAYSAPLGMKNQQVPPNLDAPADSALRSDGAPVTMPYGISTGGVTSAQSAIKAPARE